MDWHTGAEEGGELRVLYRAGECLNGIAEGSLKRHQDARISETGAFHAVITDPKTLAEEGLALVARKVLESRKEGLKLNESAAVVNNTVKRIRRTIEARCELLKREIDSSAEQAYVTLNNVLNDFCDEGKRFKGALDSFNLVMKRCKTFVERFKRGELIGDLPVESGDEGQQDAFSEHLLQILATLVKTHTPAFEFNLDLVFKPNNNSIGPHPLGRLSFDCTGAPPPPPDDDDDDDEAERKTKSILKGDATEDLVSCVRGAADCPKQGSIAFKLIRNLTYWRSVECVSDEMRPLGLVSLTMLKLPNSKTFNELPNESSDEITPNQPASKAPPIGTEKKYETLLATKLSEQGIDVSLSNAADVRSAFLQRSYLLLSTSSEIEIFNEGLNQLVKCVKVSSLKEPVDIVSWKEWVAISNSSSDFIHIISMFTKVVSKFHIPGGCGNLSVDDEGKITITSRHGSSIVLFDAVSVKMTRIKLPSSLTKATHAVRVRAPKGPVSPDGSLSKRAREDVFVVCQADRLHRVCMVNAAGEILRSFGDQKGSSLEQVNKPKYVLADDHGNFLVSDSGNCRLLVLGADLKLVKEISLRPLEVARPTKISLDCSNRLLFITDPRNRCIVVTHYSSKPSSSSSSCCCCCCDGAGGVVE